MDQVEFTAGLSSYIHLTKYILLLSFSTHSALTKRLAARNQWIFRIEKNVTNLLNFDIDAIKYFNRLTALNCETKTPACKNELTSECSKLVADPCHRVFEYKRFEYVKSDI